MKGHRGIGEREPFLDKGFSSLPQACRREPMPFQRLLCHRIPPRSFSGAIIYISKRKGSGMEADASLSGASRQCPLSLLPAVTRPFHRSCTEQGNAVSVQRSGSRYLLSGIAGRALGVPRKIFSASDRAEAASLAQIPFRASLFSQRRSHHFL